MTQLRLNRVTMLCYKFTLPKCGIADPVAARSEMRALIARTLDRGFKSRSRHGCLSASFYVVLSCVGRGLATG
jgi:hypothetical protein